MGRSRGGLSTKIHQLCDGHGLPLVVLIGPGHAHDSPMFEALMDQLRVPRAGRGRPRTGGAERTVWLADSMLRAGRFSPTGRQVLAERPKPKQTISII